MINYVVTYGLHSLLRLLDSLKCNTLIPQEQILVMLLVLLLMEYLFSQVHLNLDSMPMLHNPIKDFHLSQFPLIFVLVIMITQHSIIITLIHHVS